MRRTILPLAALVLAGCQGDPAMPAACRADAAAYTAAAHRAPPALAGGVPISRCVSRARSDGDVQAVGIAITTAVESLALDAARDPDAARALGMLAGAVQRGSGDANGVAEELSTRVTRTAKALEPANARSAAALRAGLRTGRAAG